MKIQDVVKVHKIVIILFICFVSDLFFRLIK